MVDCDFDYDGFGGGPWPAFLKWNEGRYATLAEAQANLPNELERGVFILDRLYPEMPARHREQFRAKFSEEFRAGRWNGFQRPSAPDGDRPEAAD